MAALNPHKVPNLKAMIPKAICATDEYAIKIFISNWKEQTNPTHSRANPLKQKIKFFIGLTILSSAMRTKPTAPNFNKIAARNIEPLTGASTCALGSHI